MTFTERLPQVESQPWQIQLLLVIQIPVLADALVFLSLICHVLQLKLSSFPPAFRPQVVN